MSTEEVWMTIGRRSPCTLLEKNDFDKQNTPFTKVLHYLLIEHSILVASEDATCGSVTANPDRILLLSKGISHLCSCSLFP